MKRSQWIAASVGLVGLVCIGSIFFAALSWMGTPGESLLSDMGEPLALTFPVKAYPNVTTDGETLRHLSALEVKKPGYQDYWFENENDRPVRLGGVSKSCKCQGVAVYVLPDGFSMPRPAPRPTPPAAAADPVGLPDLDATTGNNESTRGLEAKAEAAVVIDPEEEEKGEATVPPHRTGWVRMKWTGEKAGPQNLTIKLWMDRPNSGLHVTLQRRADFVDPVRVLVNDRPVGRVRVDELPKQFSFVVWSPTRSTFKVTKAEAVRPTGLSASADPFVVGVPVELTAEGRARAEQNLKQGRVLSGYRVPVTLLKVAPDGKTRFDLGSFRRSLEVATDVLDRPFITTYSGVVEDENIQFAGLDVDGGVQFGVFPRTGEPRQSVVIHGGSPGLHLELDKSRLPEYLRGTLSEEPAAGESVKTWKLELRVSPNVYGSFPRDGDPAYRDSAVYVRMGGDSRQSIRIPVRGDAMDR